MSCQRASNPGNRPVQVDFCVSRPRLHLDAELNRRFSRVAEREFINKIFAVVNLATRPAFKGIIQRWFGFRFVLHERIQVQGNRSGDITYLLGLSSLVLAVLVVSFIVIVFVVSHIAIVDIGPLLIAVFNNWRVVCLLDAKLSISLLEHSSSRSALGLLLLATNLHVVLI